MRYWDVDVGDGPECGFKRKDWVENAFCQTQSSFDTRLDAVSHANSCFGHGLMLWRVRMWL